MIFAIVVHGHPETSQSALSALKFARAVLSGGHELYRIFFYHDAVHIADANAVTPQDETSTRTQWSEFASANSVELAVCIAAGLKRGVLNEAESERYGRTAASADPQFQVVGLGQLIDAAMVADRLVTFAA